MSQISKEEFCARFKAHMLKLRGEKFDDGTSIAEYADEVAPTYLEDLPETGSDETPEECAETDMSYWGQ